MFVNWYLHRPLLFVPRPLTFVFRSRLVTCFHFTRLTLNDVVHPCTFLQKNKFMPQISIEFLTITIYYVYLACSENPKGGPKVF